MKLYVAAPYKFRGEAFQVSLDLKEAGYEVTSRWLESHLTDWEVLSGNPEAAYKEAVEDIEDIEAADVMVVLNYPPFDEVSGGKYFEMGVAYASRMPTVFVGQRTHIFHHLLHDHAMVEDIPGLLKELELRKADLAQEQVKLAEIQKHLSQILGDLGEDPKNVN